MPAEAAGLVRASWQALLKQVPDHTPGAADCVVHGDLGAGAVLVADGRVSIIDWDEARVDAAAFDLAGLPRAVRRRAGAPAGLDDDVLDVAALAWETATCWSIEPDYAHRCLQRLHHHPPLLP